MKFQSFIIFLATLIRLINCIFIRSNNIYEHIINDIQKYYQCNFISIFYALPNNKKTIDKIIKYIEITTRLTNLQLYFNRNLIYTNIIDIKIFIDQQSLKVKTMKDYSKKSLFVFLNDFDEEKSQFHNLLIPSLDITTPKWLFFFRNTTTIDEFFTNTYIPFNSHCLVSMTNSDNYEVITEIYRIHKDGELKKNIFALWNLDNGIQLPKAHLYQRRNDLFGYNFRASTIMDSPYTLVSYTRNHDIKLNGIIGQIMKYLKKELNFTITYRLTQEYGEYLKNGSWTGGIADIVNNVSDIFASSIAMSSLRKEAVDFTMPIFFSDDIIFFKKPTKDHIEWNKFLKPFQSGVWIVIICLIIITSSTVTLILLFYKQTNKQQLNENRESCFMSDNILLIYGAFCGQAIRRSFVNSVFIIHITLHITATILLAAYSATLISSLTISDFKAPFTSLTGFYKDGTYRMGFIKSSIYSDLFKVSNDSVMKNIYDTAIKYNTITLNTRDGINRVCIEKKYAFMAPKYIGHLFHAENCTLIVSKSVMRLSKGIALKQHNPFQALFNYHIARMKKHGILDRIIKDAIKIPAQSENEPWEAVQIIDVAPLLVLLIINIFLGLIILWIEKQIYKKFKKQRLLNFSQFSIQHITDISKKTNELLSLQI